MGATGPTDFVLTQSSPEHITANTINAAIISIATIGFDDVAVVVEIPTSRRSAPHSGQFNVLMPRTIYPHAPHAPPWVVGPLFFFANTATTAKTIPTRAGKTRSKTPKGSNVRIPSKAEYWVVHTLTWCQH